ncbi:MAG TPA: hypothetical protein P5014_01395 [Patescibacteria group bacterium]|nr:hypothetical protein [bacterium]HRY56797.1 hypothetical protein [Patescibacteria group bacterium]
MALITAHFDVSGIDFLIKKTKKNTEFFNFPYVYTKGIFGNQCDQKQFYSNIVEKVMSDREIKNPSCDVLTCGFPDSPELNLKTKYSVKTLDLIESSEGIVPVFINNKVFLTKGMMCSYELDEDEDFLGNENDLGEFDQIANLNAYPQTTPDDLSSQVSLDSKICEKIPERFRFESGRKIVFTGGRFTQKILNPELNYILILEALRGLGVFNVYLDSSNAYSLLRTVQMYDRSLVPDIESFFDTSGFFIRTGGSCECLINNGLGDDKFIEIEDNKVFIYPFRSDTPARLSIKSRELGTIDVHTNGGSLGIVFDTRAPGDSIYDDVKLLNESVKQFENVLKDR